jgi:hypothetical protein
MGVPGTHNLIRAPFGFRAAFLRFHGATGSPNGAHILATAGQVVNLPRHLGNQGTKSPFAADGATISRMPARAA